MSVLIPTWSQGLGAPSISLLDAPRSWRIQELEKKAREGKELSVAVRSLKYGWEDLQSSVKHSSKVSGNAGRKIA